VPNRIELRQEVEVPPQPENGIFSWIRDSDVSSSDRKEFVANLSYERAREGLSDEAVIREDILDKASFLKTFRLLLPSLGLVGGERVLEMGACHGWASVLIKQRFPGCTVVAADLLEDAIEHATKWESLFETQLDEKWACHCRHLPFADAQFDLIFTFASFHHFGVSNDFSGALSEMLRVLKPGGRIVLLYEPSCPPFLYGRAHRAVNRRREEEGVDEDLLVPARLSKTVGRLGAAIRIEYFPEPRFRDSPVSTLYYFLLSRFRWLCPLAMCTVNVEIAKR